METDNNAAQCWHTAVSTALGELTLVRDADALRGYAGGLARKRFLLDLEQPARPTLDLPVLSTGSGAHQPHVPERAVASR